MAKKSKTQKAKASAARQQRKADRELDAQVPAIERTDAGASSESASAGKAVKKAESKPKKKRFQFLREVRSEMKRVTWPTRTDVLRWSGVVIVALLFFGIFVAVLDNAVITPLLVLISGIGA